jgi:hypothetical protein
MAKATSFYCALMAAVEHRRAALGWPMWRVDEEAGISEGYYSKMLHADSAEGRRATWEILQKVANALWPEGRCTVRLLAQDPDSMLPGAAIKATNRAFQTYLRSYFISLGRLGAKARNAKLTPEQRSEAARRANFSRQRKRRAAAPPTEAPAPRKPRWGVGSVPMTRGRHADDLTA